MAPVEIMQAFGTTSDGWLSLVDNKQVAGVVLEVAMDSIPTLLNNIAFIVFILFTFNVLKDILARLLDPQLNVVKYI